MPWSLIVGLLIDFLVSWLVSLLEQIGHFNRSALSIRPERIASQRAQFIRGVTLRFWIGSQRLEAAEKAFDLMLENLADPMNTADIASDFDRGDYKAIAMIACKGIREKLS